MDLVSSDQSIKEGELAMARRKNEGWESYAMKTLGTERSCRETFRKWERWRPISGVYT